MSVHPVDALKDFIDLEPEVEKQLVLICDEPVFEIKAIAMPSPEPHYFEKRKTWSRKRFKNKRNFGRD